MPAELSELVARAEKAKELGALKHKIEDGTATEDERRRAMDLVSELDTRGQAIARRFERGG